MIYESLVATIPNANGYLLVFTETTFDEALHDKCRAMGRSFLELGRQPSMVLAELEKMRHRRLDPGLLQLQALQPPEDSNET
jgi:hypothetical protein